MAARLAVAAIAALHDVASASGDAADAGEVGAEAGRGAHDEVASAEVVVPGIRRRTEGVDRGCCWERCRRSCWRRGGNSGRDSRWHSRRRSPNTVEGRDGVDFLPTMVDVKYPGARHRHVRAHSRDEEGIRVAAARIDSVCLCWRPDAHRLQHQALLCRSALGVDVLPQDGVELEKDMIVSVLLGPNDPHRPGDGYAGREKPETVGVVNVGLGVAADGARARDRPQRRVAAGNGAPVPSSLVTLLGVDRADGPDVGATDVSLQAARARSRQTMAAKRCTAAEP